MKKTIFVSLLALAGILSLSSCRKSSSGDDMADTSSKETPTYINYIKDKITFSTTALNNDSIEDKDKLHYEIFLPENIDASYRLSVADASSLTKKTKGIYANYFSLEDSWGTSKLNEIIDILDDFETLNVFNNVSTEVEIPENYYDTEASSRRLATLYIPLQVNYVGGSDVDPDDEIYGYIFAPTYTVLTTLSNDVLADSKAQSYNNDTYLINFNSKISE